MRTWLEVTSPIPEVQREDWPSHFVMGRPFLGATAAGIFREPSRVRAPDGKMSLRMTAASRRLRLLLTLAIPFWICNGAHARAQRITFQSYGKADGLGNAWFSCLSQDRSGFVFACTQHGLYVYDGRRFLNLGSRQGLPDGGIVDGIAFNIRNRLVVRYPHAVFVSISPIGPHAPPAALLFRPAVSEVGPIPDDATGQVLPWGDGVVFAGQGRLFVVHAGGAGVPTVSFAPGFPLGSPPGFLRQPSVPLRDPSPLVVQDTGPGPAGGSAGDLGPGLRGPVLWTVRADGSICGLDAAAARCFGPSEGLPAEEWSALLVMGNGHILARSALLLADIDPVSGHVAVSPLPDQGGRYANYPEVPLLALTPSGQLLTQSADGLMIRDASGWKTLATDNGLPPVPILRLMFDRQGDLWLGVLGRGIMRALGYGAWENLDHHDGLANDVLWQMARQPDGPLWVASDGGIDAIGGPPGLALAHRHYGEAAFSLAVDDRGRLWRSVGSTAVACITPGTGETTRFPLLQARQILLGPNGQLWFVTTRGVYVAETGPVPQAPRPIAGLLGSVTTAAIAADGSLWVLRGRELLHRHADNSVASVTLNWQQPEFEPLTLVAAPDGVLWIAGAGGGGLYRLRLNGDRIVSSDRFQPPDIVSNSIVSLLVDHRGWLWAGTDNGVSVFNNRRWVSATTDTGLIWDDLDQGGLLEDSDGSIWIGTSQGLSHLRDPPRLFRDGSPQPVIAAVTVGGIPFRERAVPFTRDPFVIQLGTLDFRSSSVIRFRYRLCGVDHGWADTASGEVRYASVPPGHRRFEVVAYDPLTHRASAPVSVLLRVREPWWLWWPSLVGYGVVLLGLAYAGLRLRFRFLLRQRRMLQRAVEAQTLELREAHAALRLQASRDSLTGLLTRGEIQSRLVAMLTEAAHPPDHPADLTVGLLDIDHFKRINDRHGHLAGDDILQEIGHRLNLALEPCDCAGRYGGEEMLVVVQAEPGFALERIHALQQAVCGPAFRLEHQALTVTCSIGVAYARGRDDWTALVGRADAALYRAKMAGRDRIVAFDDADLIAQRR